jgi:hypothetical protein
MDLLSRYVRLQAHEVVCCMLWREFSHGRGRGWGGGRMAHVVV